jgi:aspartyl-tRNA(Asn)/glutamyl-tRNA(Gln) amidotransferase subunit A
VLYSREGTVEQVVRKTHELGQQGVQFPTFPETVVPYRSTSWEFFAAIQKRGALGALMNRSHERLPPRRRCRWRPSAQARTSPNLLKEKRWTDWTPFTYPFNLTQQPAAAIPCGLTKKRLPVGLHIVGPRYADALVLRATRAFESAHPIRIPEVAGLAQASR